MVQYRSKYHWLMVGIICPGFGKMLRFLSLFLVFHCSYARHLQFQLSGYECFYEDIDEKTECSLEFAPITGNDPKIDVSIEDPNGGILYKIEKKDYDLHKFTTKMNGTYRVCFSNVYEFAIGDNLVYFDFITGKDTSFDQTVAPSDKALTQLETSLATIHENMNLVERYQNYHRLREANGRLAGEHLNQRVQWWSIGQSMVVVAVGMTQVFVLRRFFTVTKQQL